MSVVETLLVHALAAYGSWAGPGTTVAACTAESAGRSNGVLGMTEVLAPIVGLLGVLVGGVLTFWHQRRARQAEDRHRLRLAYSEWSKARLRLDRCESRMLGIVLSSSELALRRPHQDSPEQAEWQVTISGLERELASVSKEADEAQATAEGAYSLILMMDHDQRRLGKLNEIHAGQSPYVAATAAAVGKSYKLDVAVYDEVQKRNSRQMGLLAVAVERTLRLEAMHPLVREWLRFAEDLKVD